MELKYKKIKRKKNKIKKIVIGTVVGLILLAALIVFGLFRIQSVEVVGNEYYSADEIKKMVMSDSLAQNSIYLTWKYSHINIKEELPYLSAVEVEMVAPYKVRIRVYEKTVVGYIKKAGSNVYFDKDGMIMENSQEVRKGVPMISGVDMDKPEVLKKLPIKDAQLFKAVIDVTQLLSKNEIVPDEIRVDQEQEISLYFGKNTVLFGQNKDLEAKISNLKAISPKLGTMQGTLDMQNYTQDSSTVTFKKEEGSADGTDQSEGDSNSESDSDKAVTDAGGYAEKSSRITKGADGNDIYTDDAGNVTSDLTKRYLGTDGKVQSDGYGYIDPYTGAYIN